MKETTSKGRANNFGPSFKRYWNTLKAADILVLGLGLFSLGFAFIADDKVSAAVCGAAGGFVIASTGHLVLLRMAVTDIKVLLGLVEHITKG
jgi:hypothetical protein